MPETNNRERRFITFELRAGKAETGEMRISGYSAKFDMWTEIPYWGEYYRERIAPGAFADTIAAGDDVRALFNHDPNIVLGRTANGTLVLREDDTGLWMENVLPETTQARDIYTLIERGDITQQSFAFEVMPEGETWAFPSKAPMERTLTNLRLWDVSPVTYPAYVDTTVAARSLESARKVIVNPARSLSQVLALRERELKI